MDRSQDLSQLDLDNLQVTDLETHVDTLNVEDDAFTITDSKGDIVEIAPFSEGGSDSLLSLEIVDDEMVQVFSLSGESTFPLERRTSIEKPLTYQGEGVLTNITDQTFTFNNPFGTGFSIEETADAIEVDLTGDVGGGASIGLSYEKYAAFAHISAGDTGISGGSTANVRCALTTTLINNIPDSVHRPNAGHTVFLQPGTYWVHLSMTWYSADGGRTSIALATATDVAEGTGLTAQANVGKNPQDCGRLITIAAASNIYVNQTRTRNVMTYGGGDFGGYNVNLLLEVFKIG